MIPSVMYSFTQNKVFKSLIIDQKHSAVTPCFNHYKFFGVHGNRDNGIFTLHGTGTGTGTGQVQGTEKGLIGSNILYRCIHTGLRQGNEADPLSPIMPVPFPVPVPIPVPCSVNAP